MVDIGIWDDDVSVDEMVSFYKLDECQSTNNELPYIWSMTVSSYDGIIGFKEHSIEPGKDPQCIALSNFIDFKLLNLGWTMCDASVISAGCLRDEPNIVMAPEHFPDLQSIRLNHKKSMYPIHIVITGSGDIPLKHRIITQSSITSIIITTETGKNNLENQYYGDGTFDKDLNFYKYLENGNTCIKIFDSTEPNGNILSNFSNIFKELKKEYNINFMDVSGGGRLISSLIEEKIINEMRLTIAGQLCGSLNSNGERRPTLFPSTKKSYTPETAPFISHKSIRLHKDQWMFLRSTVNYRH